jgi:hypothetical protein
MPAGRIRVTCGVVRTPLSCGVVRTPLPSPTVRIAHPLSGGAPLPLRWCGLKPSLLIIKLSSIKI